MEILYSFVSLTGTRFATSNFARNTDPISCIYIYIDIMVNVSNLIDKDYNNVESECFVMSKKKSRKLDNYEQNC